MNFKSFSKKAVVGASIATIIVTIAIVLLLVVYAILGVIVKNTRGAPKEFNSQLKESEKLEIEFNNYFSNFKKLTKARKMIWLENTNVDAALQITGWGKNEK